MTATEEGACKKRSRPSTVVIKVMLTSKRGLQSTTDTFVKDEGSPEGLVGNAETRSLANVPSVKFDRPEGGGESLRKEKRVKRSGQGRFRKDHFKGVESSRRRKGVPRGGSSLKISRIQSCEGKGIERKSWKKRGTERKSLVPSTNRKGERFTVERKSH